MLQEVLQALPRDRQRFNERSALVYLALLDLPPERTRAEATNPMVGTTLIMDWLRDKYDKGYKPTTRETVRRQTLHQFAGSALVVQNPDEPDRPVTKGENICI